MVNISKILDYAQLLRLNKPIGILLLLWPTLMALWIAAEGKPSSKLICVFVLGVIVMRSAGCGINDILDRNFDGFVERTKNRPLVLGKVTLREACILVFCLLILALILVTQLNLITFYGSIIALILAGIYPLMKRYTHLPQLVLSAAFAWAIPMVFTATIGKLTVSAGILFMATLFWVVAYDTQYAIADREDDLKIGVKSTAILFGKYDRLIILILQLLSLSLFLLLGFHLNFGKIYYLGICCASLFVIYQQYLLLEKTPESAFKAFLNNNYYGAAIYSGLLLDTLFDKI
jgi:4-hydroxybenzoate polyprenyltransferase